MVIFGKLCANCDNFQYIRKFSNVPMLAEMIVDVMNTSKNALQIMNILHKAQWIFSSFNF